MRLSNPQRLHATHVAGQREEREPCPAERDGRACLLLEGHGYNHVNGHASWGHLDGLDGASCSSCRSDLVPVVGGFRCAGCGQEAATPAPVPCGCGAELVIVRPEHYECHGCRRTAPKEQGT